MEPGKGIFTAIPAIMAEIGSVSKSRKNLQQGYSFRGIDEVYLAAQPIMAKHGVFVLPYIVAEVREEKVSRSGGAMMWTRLTIDHHFTASDGSHVTARTIGEAMDSGDKATNKAMSAAMKYALLEVFCIPTEEPKDTEHDSPEVKAATPVTPPEARATDVAPKAPANAVEANTTGASVVPSSSPTPATLGALRDAMKKLGLGESIAKEHDEAAQIHTAANAKDKAKASKDAATAARRDAYLGWCGNHVGRKLTSTKELTAAEAGDLIGKALRGEMVS